MPMSINKAGDRNANEFIPMIGVLIELIAKLIDSVCFGWYLIAEILSHEMEIGRVQDNLRANLFSAIVLNGSIFSNNKYKLLILAAIIPVVTFLTLVKTQKLRKVRSGTLL